MNIEEILPELFGEKRVYYCQRSVAARGDDLLGKDLQPSGCLNHGRREKRKNHKLNCLYRMCQCSDCIMVERRRELNSRLLQIEGSATGLGIDGGECIPKAASIKSDDDDELERSSCGGKSKERRPNCQRCAQHNVVNRLKGHKRACPFKECCCPKCQVVVERQKLMADQIKLRRRQKREKNLMIGKELKLSPQSPNSSSEHACLECTQQVIGYQLLSFINPMFTPDPMLTLADVLAACPHKNK